jgi:hypothetical protein
MIISGPRRLCPRQGEGPGHHLHRRVGRDRHEALRQREGGRQGGAEDHARAAQPARRLQLHHRHQGHRGH